MQGIAGTTIELDGKEYSLRKWVLLDDAWAKEKFGKDTFELLSSIKDAEILSRMVFQLMDYDSKSDFAYKMEKSFDEEGRPVNEGVPSWKQIAKLIDAKDSAIYERVLNGITMSTLGKTVKEVQELAEEAVEPEGGKKSKAKKSASKL